MIFGEKSRIGGTPKSSILAGFSFINHPAIGVPPFMETPIRGEFPLLAILLWWRDGKVIITRQPFNCEASSQPLNNSRDPKRNQHILCCLFSVVAVVGWRKTVSFCQWYQTQLATVLKIVQKTGSALPMKNFPRFAAQRQLLVQLGLFIPGTVRFDQPETRLAAGQGAQVVRMLHEINGTIFENHRESVWVDSSNYHHLLLQP